MLLALMPIPPAVVAQPNRQGISMMKHYPLEIVDPTAQPLSITRDGRGILYIGNGTQDLLEYDGVRWNTIRVPGNPAIHSLITGDDGVVYVGAEAEFGALLPDRSGRVRYRSLAGGTDREIFPVSGKVRVCTLHGKILFCTPSHIYMVTPGSRSFETLDIPDRALDFFPMDSLLLFTTADEGFMQLDRGSVDSLPGGDLLRGRSISGILPYAPSRLLVATRSNGLLLLNPEAGTLDPSWIDPELQRYLKAATITCLSRSGDGFAIGTLNRGVILLDREGNALQMISASNGLPDPSVGSLYAGPPGGGSGPLWIAHGKGVTLLETDAPFRLFTEGAGFEGRITDITQFGDRLFVATTEGLYFRYSSSLTTRFQPVPELRGEEIRQLLVFRPSRWRSLMMAVSEKNIWLIEPSLRIHPLKESILPPDRDTLRSIDVAGQVLVQDPHRPDIIFIARHLLYGLEYSRRGWVVVAQADLPPQASRDLGIDRYGFLWSASLHTVIRMDLSRLSHIESRIYGTEQGLPAGNQARVFIDPDRETLLLGTVDGLYRFDYFRNRFYRDTLLNPLLPEGKNRVHSFYRDPGGDLWLSFDNGYSGWKDAVIRRNAEATQVMTEYPFGRLSRQPTEVFYGIPGKGTWFGKSDTLYHSDTAVFRQKAAPAGILIRRVSLGQDSVLFGGAYYRSGPDGRYRLTAAQGKDDLPEIDYRYNDPEFTWAAPVYGAGDRMQYSMKLKGLDAQWSEWDTLSSKTYTGLRPGLYSFGVKAMNACGKVSPPASFEFRIRRPWYGSFPALFIYMLLGAGGIALLYRLRNKRP